MARRGAPGAGGAPWKSGELNEGAAGGGGHGEVVGAAGQVGRPSAGVTALDGCRDQQPLRRQWGLQTEELGQELGTGALPGSQWRRRGRGGRGGG